MTAMHKLRPEPGTRSSHRIYRDPDPAETVFCRAIHSEQELLRLAGGIDRVELRQAPGSGWIPAAMTTPLVEALRAIDLVGGSADPRAERLEREMRRRMADALARIRIRCNRHLLAGVTQVFSGETESRVLVLAFAGAGITTCEWHLAI